MPKRKTPNPKWDFAGPVGNKPQQLRNPTGGSGPVAPADEGWTAITSLASPGALHVAGDAPALRTCGSRLKSDGGSCRGAQPSIPLLTGLLSPPGAAPGRAPTVCVPSPAGRQGTVPAMGPKPGASASKAAVSAGVGGMMKGSGQ